MDSGRSVLFPGSGFFVGVLLVFWEVFCGWYGCGFISIVGAVALRIGTVEMECWMGFI